MGFGQPGLPGQAAPRHVGEEPRAGPTPALLRSQVVVERLVPALILVRAHLALQPAVVSITQSKLRIHEVLHYSC